MTIRQLLEEGTRILSGAGIGEASTDAWILMRDTLKIEKTWFLLHGEDPVCEEDADVKRYREQIFRRAAHEPLQYIEQKAYFMGFEFYVSPTVLIPRFDTEVLVEEAIKHITKDAEVLDLCTGSGCIAISIAKLTGAHVTGVDISKEALLIAEQNKKRLEADNVDFILSDMFAFAEDGKQYDYIVSNPPYIRNDVIPTLDIEVRDKEPMLALDGGADGLSFYRILAQEGFLHLRDGGALIMEIGWDQAEDVRNILEENNFTDIFVRQDLAGLDRVICGWRK